MRREFYQTHTVRYDECNNNGLLTPAAFLRYMQNIAAQDAEDVQLGGNGYWVVKRTLISFLKPVPIYTKLELKTYGIGFSRITAQRGYEAHIAGGSESEMVVSARTLWVFVDPNGRPARLPERTASIWLPDGPRLPEPDTAFPAFPESKPAIASASVRFSDIDLMSHLNNATAVERLDDAAWDVYAQHGMTPDTTQLDVLSYDIEYKDSPRFGDQFEIQSWFETFPVKGQGFARFQQIIAGDKVMIRAHSRWQWRV